ncbi:Protein O-linked-mannose beta-1,2-N-acetylglucosaminyltransferase 1 [Hondaea fermentalgiana]|uniref:Protein O-linked-mannose beta-1,2-N-acetylglucosaminyltransferase 1 n=1 Tax=Hondaea fermentalgiana TaxID=2315210 RepID=A0A2R5G123_9STRA|nr:Protein O-linked-mannose beta-1,2-N-acetylglucosaminyltransferase 1 [Hondaea fermentalgiana]|eukprot:GBG24702.1 Protein O-linked-mannose beta-1,2-N-acetylglucosaminyltransferase 1 [Hondaea fermentalgiana]
MKLSRRQREGALCVLVAVGLLMVLLSSRALERSTHDEDGAVRGARRIELIRAAAFDVQEQDIEDREDEQESEHEKLDKALRLQQEELRKTRTRPGVHSNPDLTNDLQEKPDTSAKGSISRRHEEVLDIIRAERDRAEDDVALALRGSLAANSPHDGTTSTTAQRLEDLELYLAEHGHFPVVLLCYNREKRVRDTLESLFQVRGIQKSLVLVVQDGQYEPVSQVVLEAGVELVQRGPEMVDAEQRKDPGARIAQHYKFALGYAMSHFADAPGIIIIEDDFLFSPDFVEYFSTVAPAIIKDPTLWLASAWNDNGFAGNVQDKERLLRTDYFPGLGWLLMRSIWEELAPKWPSSHWDWFMRDPKNSQHRDSIYPEVPRDFHTGSKGSFMDERTHRLYFDSIAHNKDPTFRWPQYASESVLQAAYDERLNCHIKAGISLDHGIRLTQNPMTKSLSDEAAKKRPIIIWLDADPHPRREMTVKKLAEKLHIWHQLLRGSRAGIHEFWHHGSKIIMVNVFTPGPDPCVGPRQPESCEWFHGYTEQSRFAKLRPAHARVFRPLELYAEMKSSTSISLPSITVPEFSFESCPPGGTYWTMYHCYRECLGITTGKCNRCQDGYYGYNSNQTCALCEPGRYCQGGSDQGECDAGYYCEAGSSSKDEMPCPPGTYGETTGLEDSSCSGPCFAGYWCESGSTDPEQYPCIEGQWGGSGQTNQYCSGPCSAGYYCPAASASSKANACGSASVYCPEGSAEPVPVDEGFYSTPLSVAENVRTSQTVCPKGSYCTGGKKYACPAGNYAPSIGLPSCASYVCAAGYYCPEGSTSSTAGPCYEGEVEPEHPAIYYCPAGTTAPLEVLDGYYSTPESALPIYRTGMELADTSLYITRYGLRLRKVEWMGSCEGNTGDLSIAEVTNDGLGDARENTTLTNLLVFDNINDANISTGDYLSFVDTDGLGYILPYALNQYECVAWVQENGFPFEILEDGALAIRSGYFLDYETCPTYIFDVLATSVSGDATATCRMTVEIINESDLPYFEFKTTVGYPFALPSVLDFYVDERSATNTGVGSPIRANDEDVGQDITFEIVADTLDGPEDMFYIGSCSGQLYVFDSGLDYITKNTYELQIRVCDDYQFFGASTEERCSITANVTIHVLDVNDVPFWKTDPYEITSFRVPENSPENTLLEAMCGDDPCAELDSSILGLQVDDLDLNNDGSSTTDVMSYSIERNFDDFFAVVTCVRDDNLDQCAVTETINAPAGALRTTGAAALDYESRNAYSITVRVNDGRGGTNTLDVAIEITDENDPPEWPAASAQESLTFSENSGAASGRIFATDEDSGDEITYSVVGAIDEHGDDATDLFEMENNNSVTAAESSLVTLQLTTGSTLDYEDSKNYTVTVQAEDIEGASATFDFTVHVRDVNESPVITTSELSVPENVAFGTAIAEAIAFTDVDAGQTGFFVLETGLNANMFAVAASTGVVTVRGDLDYETQDTYSIRVSVSDNGVPSIKTTKVITIRVTDEPEPPTFGSSQTYTVTETEEVDETWVASIDVVDEDGSDFTMEILSQVVASTGKAVDYFVVDGNTLVQNTSMASPINFESSLFTTFDDQNIRVTLYAEDDGGLNSTATVTIAVLDANDRPVLANTTTSVPKHVENYDENEPDRPYAPGFEVLNVFELCSDEDVDDDDRVTDITYAIVSGNDDGTFELVDGVLKVKTVTTNVRTENYEYVLGITATDHDVSPLTSQIAYITVLVTGENYPPSIDSHALTLVENEDDFAVIISDMGASDPDGSNLVFEVAGASPSAAAVAFFVEPSNGTLYLTQTLDYETMTNEDGTLVLTIRVRDNGGVEAYSLSALGTVTITVEDVNEVPAFDASSYSISVNEMTASGILGDPIVAIDPDAADVGQLRYALLDAEDSPFEVNELSGQLSTDGTLDFENPQALCTLSAGGIHTCELDLVVTDSVNHTASASITVRVLNINEAPVFNGTKCGQESYNIVCTDVNTTLGIIEVPETIYDFSPIRIGTLLSSDPDKISQVKLAFATAYFVFPDGVEQDTGETLMDDLFLLDDSGVLYLVGSLDFENRSVYSYAVKLSDEGNGEQAALDQDFTIEIRVVNENDIGPVAASTASDPWPTAGGDAVTLTGSNFGPTQFKIDNEGAEASDVRAYLVQKGTLRLFEASGCTVVSDTEVSCTSSPKGVGSELYWMVSFPELDHNSTLDFDDDSFANRFQDPVITSVTGADAFPTMGGAVFDLVGTDFGAAGLPFVPEVEVRYRSRMDRDTVYTAQNCSILSSVDIECTSTVSTGPKLEFMVVVQGQQALSWHGGDGTNYSHTAPTIASVAFEVSTITEMKTKGGSSTDAILITGTNFGPVGTSIAVTYGPVSQTSKFTATSCAVISAHTVVRCIYVAGSGVDLRFVVSANSVRSEASVQGLSYAGPTIESISGSGSENARTSGGDTVYISGSGFGPVTEIDGTVVARYGGENGIKYYATDCAVIREDTQISCLTASGTGRDHPWTVSISGQSSEVTEVAEGLIMSYSAPTINYFEGTESNAVTDGGDEVVLVGLDFGDQSDLITVTFGATGTEYTARNCIIDPDYLHSKILCELPPGVGKELKWTVVVDGQASRVPTTNYQAPGVDTLSGSPIEDGASTIGGEIFYIQGSDFGPRALHDENEEVVYSFSYGGSGGKKYKAANCTILEPEPSLLSTSPSGSDPIDAGEFSLEVDGVVTASIPFNASADDVQNALRDAQTGVLFNVSVTVNEISGARVWEILTPSLPREAITIQTSSLTANGSNAAIVIEQPSLGASAARCVTVPGVGANLGLVATIAGQSSNVSAVTLSYKAPEISSFTPSLGVSAKGFQLNVSGTNFGNEGVTVSFAGVTLTGAEVSEHSTITVPIPNELQRNANNAVEIEVEGQTVIDTYSFSPPVVTSITAVNPPQNLDGPPQEILIRGSSFGEYHPELGDSITVGGEECLLADWTHDSIRCNLTTLTGEMVITVGEQVCRNNNGSACCPCDFSYENLLAPPTVLSVSACGLGQDLSNCTTDGGYEITVFGANLGSGIYGSVYIGDEIESRECLVADPVEDYTETEIRCIVPPGEGKELQVVVHHAWQVSDDNVVFSYDQPHLRAVTPEAFSTYGASNLTIVGSNFGTSGPRVELRPHGNASLASLCEVLYFDHESIECFLPEGQGQLEIAVFAGEQEASSVLAFAYFPPFVKTISPVEGLAQGYYPLTVVGSNFGVTGTVYVGENECETITYAHELITCNMPKGAGANLPVYVESGRYTSNLNVTFTYLPPEVYALEPNHGPTIGGDTIIVHGANFHNSADLEVRIGSFLCENPISLTASEINCTSPEGVGTNLTVTVTVANQSSVVNYDPEAVFDFDQPTVNRVLPYPTDARGGGTLYLEGANFGDDDVDPEAFVRVLVDGYVCTEAERKDHSSIECQMPTVLVGEQPIFLEVALQSLDVDPDQGAFAACTANYYGRPGEFCLPCPDGAMCLGYVDNWHYDPASISGYGSLNRSLFQTCNPTEACLGNDTCAEGYVHQNDRLKLCGKCAEDFYRLEGKCEPCPNLAWLILIACFLVAVILCSVAYFLTKYGVQLAAVSICIDFCQVVSLFSTYDFAWPSVVSGAYAVLSAFNLNLELASPECSVGWDYETKWYIMYFMPVVFGLLFTTSFIVAFVKLAVRKVRREIKAKTGALVAPLVVKTDENDKLATLGDDEKVLLVDDDDMESYDASFNKFIDAEFGAFLLMCYYLYMSVMKKCFEVYRCTDGPVPVLRAEPAEPCDDTGEFYTRIHALAGFGIFVYGIGIPSVISFLLLKHRDFIKHDQQRREQALKLSETDAAKRLQSAFRGYYVRRVVDPRSILRQHKKLTHIGRTRAKFGKLYEDFTSECYYWRLVLMMRKLLLSMISLFLDDKFKQSTLAFGVLFSSYALQVKLKPYLSRFPDDLHKRRQAKAYKEWKRRAELRSEVNRTKGRVRALQMAVSAKMKRMGINVAKDQRLMRENMDFAQLEVNKGIAGRVQKSREKKLAKAIEDGEVDAEVVRAETSVQRHWAILRHFVTEMDNKDKFELNEEAAKYLNNDALRWIFDYNTLETISLATLMYILLFGLLFDTYEANAEDVRINVLASITIALFVMVIILFLSSVVIDVKRKFWPVVRERLLREGVRALLPRTMLRRLGVMKRRDAAGDDPAAGPRSRARGGATVAPSRDSAKAVLTARRGQWVSQVNPFATLERQNADLVRAEEARLQAILASKMRFEEELRERELKRQQEKERLEEEYRVKMASVDAELRELEEEEAAMLDALGGMGHEGEEGDLAVVDVGASETAGAALERETEEEIGRLDELRADTERALEKALLAREATAAKLDREDVEDDVSEPEQTEEALHEAREAEARALEEENFSIEQEVVMAKLEAEERDQLVQLKARQNDEVNAAIAELQRQAEEVFAGHRNQQDEIKARLQERKLRRGTTVRRRRRIGAGTSGQEEAGEGVDLEEDQGDESLAPELTEEQEQAMKELEEKLAELQSKQDREKEEFVKDLEARKEAEIQSLREQIRERVQQELSEEAAFENQIAQELEQFQEETKMLVAEIQLPPAAGAEGDEMSEEEAKRLREQYEVSMSALKEKRNAELAALREKLEKKRKGRLDATQKAEEAREEERVRELQTAEENKLKAQEKEIDFAAKQQEEAAVHGTDSNAGDEDAKAAVEKLRESFEQASSELARKQEKQRNDRREALERRLESRKRAIEQRNKKKLEAAAKKEDKVFVQALKPAAPPEEDPEVIAARLEQIKKDAVAKKAALDTKIRNEKNAQRDRMRDRLAKKRLQAEEKKKKMLVEKAKEEELMNQKLKEEEAALRERQAIELQEIEEATAEAFLDETQTESLAAGVTAWRKRREEQERKQAKGPSRSEILAADFADKAKRIEDLSSGSTNDEKAQKEATRLLKDLESLFVNLVEETDAELNKLTNEAAVQKARQKRQLRDLRRRILPDADPVSPQSPDSPLIPGDGAGKESSARAAMPINVNLDEIAFLD